VRFVFPMQLLLPSRAHNNAIGDHILPATWFCLGCFFLLRCFSPYCGSSSASAEGTIIIFAVCSFRGPLRLWRNVCCFQPDSNTHRRVPDQKLPTIRVNNVQQGCTCEGQKGCGCGRWQRRTKRWSGGAAKPILSAWLLIRVSKRYYELTRGVCGLFSA
jgi:hypothetical protein